MESSHTHNLRDLVRVANLERDRLQQASKDLEFKNNWEEVELWSEQSRYRRHGREEAESLVRAIGDRVHGVMVWIKLHW